VVNDPVRLDGTPNVDEEYAQAVARVALTAAMLLLILGFRYFSSASTRATFITATAVGTYLLLAMGWLVLVKRHPGHFVSRRAIVIVGDLSITSFGVVARLLEKAGHTVDIVGDGRKAVDAVRETVYDLLLLDCLMPEMDGFETTRAIRAAEHGTGRHLPIIALTANAMPADREACLAAGMDDYLTKPLSKPALLQALARWSTPNAKGLNVVPRRA
jgi:CheY-like chemotaxis protein